MLEMPRRVTRALTSVCVVLATACGSELPRPELGPHAPDEYVVVPYPPPAAVAEVVPPRPNSAAVWVDGQWNWRGRYYVWKRGGWVVPWRDSFFAPWHRRYASDGTLYFADPSWRSADGRRLLPPPPLIVPTPSPPARETPEPAIAQ